MPNFFKSTMVRPQLLKLLLYYIVAIAVATIPMALRHRVYSVDVPTYNDDTLERTRSKDTAYAKYTFTIQ